MIKPMTKEEFRNQLLQDQHKRKEQRNEEYYEYRRRKSAQRLYKYFNKRIVRAKKAK